MFSSNVWLGGLEQGGGMVELRCRIGGLKHGVMAELRGGTGMFCTRTSNWFQRANETQIHRTCVDLMHLDV